jgi:hypothetical protein
LNSYSEIQHYAHKFGSIQVTSKMKYNEHTEARSYAAQTEEVYGFWTKRA